MSKAREIQLNASQRAELEQVRDHHPVAYYRERASAILKISAGMALSRVAKEGLLKPRNAETVRTWVTRYEQSGMAGLAVRKGRGRKPAFFPQQRSERGE